MRSSGPGLQGALEPHIVSGLDVRILAPWCAVDSTSLITAVAGRDVNAIDWDGTCTSTCSWPVRTSMMHGFVMARIHENCSTSLVCIPGTCMPRVHREVHEDRVRHELRWRRHAIIAALLLVPVLLRLLRARTGEHIPCTRFYGSRCNQMC